MNLETSLEPRLWETVRASWEARKFTNAILDAIYMLSDVIRERSGLEGDGVPLIGAAFGGSSPKLKVNRLQTESEQNMQRGVEALLRGLYQAIRNPRSHGASQDDERDAAALLLFVDYLLRVVAKSGSPFSLTAFVGRILDPDFVPNERYSTLLVKEIPANRRLVTCREVFARRSQVDGDKVAFFFRVILGVMSAEETAELCEVISEELRQTDDDDTIRFVLQAFPAEFWPRLDEVARLRIENKLIRSVADGKWEARQRRCNGGALGTWAGRIIQHFTLMQELWRTLANKLRSSDVEQQDYVFQYFTAHAPNCFDDPPHHLVWAVKEGLKAGDSRYKNAVDVWLVLRQEDDAWRKAFAAAQASFTPAAAPGETAEPEISDDDIPF
jgi:uncharacterized protein (TIGR02391 family)